VQDSEQRDTEGAEESEEAEKEYRSVRNDRFVARLFRNAPVPQRVPLRGLRLVRALRATLLPFVSTPNLEKSPNYDLRDPFAARAGDRARTGDPQLGKLMLYQLSYARTFH
jgi:hypothetical protein